MAGMSRMFNILPKHRRFRMLFQLVGTAAVLGWVPGNQLKLVIMIVIWAVGFGRISAAELLSMSGINLLFVSMDWGALAKGVFRFNHPDLLGLPCYEFFMWGFYTLHTMRMIDG